MKILFINACVREESRTIVIAKDIMQKLNLDYVEINLEQQNLKPLNSVFLKNREQYLNNQDLSNNIFDLAKQFAAAENIIIAAPFWDLSFPAMLKIYLENICVSGITFKYMNNKPIGLCKAKKLIYVTSSGGKIFADFGYSYIKELANSFFGITETICYKAENLDVENISKNTVLNKARIIQIK